MRTNMGWWGRASMDTKTLTSAAQLAESCSLYLLQTFYNLRFPDKVRRGETLPGLDAPAAEAVLSRLGEIHRLAGEVLQMLGNAPNRA
jgi:hypothetical protein